jgi:hypothetical protein
VRKRLIKGILAPYIPDAIAPPRDHIISLTRRERVQRHRNGSSTINWRQPVKKSCQQSLIAAAVFSGIANLLMLVPAFFMLTVYDKAIGANSLSHVSGPLTHHITYVLRSRGNGGGTVKDAGSHWAKN